MLSLILVGALLAGSGGSQLVRCPEGGAFVVGRVEAPDGGVIWLFKLPDGTPLARIDGSTATLYLVQAVTPGT